MKKLLFYVLIPALTFMVSCGGGDNNDSMLSQMKQMKKMADNAKEMQDEAAENPEENNGLFSEKLIKDMELSLTDRKITDEEWARLDKLMSGLIDMDSTEAAQMDRVQLEAYFVENGYPDIDSAKADILRIAQVSDFTQKAMYSIMTLKQTYLVDGKEEYLKKAKEIGQKIDKRGWSADDLRAINNNMETIGKAMGTLLLIETYENREAPEITEETDSSAVESTEVSN
jgi:hypothetical protein